MELLWKYWCKGQEGYEFVLFYLFLCHLALYFSILIFSQIMEKMVQLGVPENDTQMVEFKLRLCRIYSSYNENILAEIGFKNCLRDQKEKILKGDTSSRTGLLYINVLFWYGFHKIKNDSIIEAKNLIDSAYNYSQKIKGLSPYQEMMILTTLGDLNTQLENYDMALQYLRSAILLGKGIGSMEMPKCYLNLGRIYQKIGSTSAARNWLTQAYDLGVLFNDTDVASVAKEILETLDEEIVFD